MNDTGVVRRGAKLLHSFAQAVVPRVTVVTRKAYGGAYIAMNSRSLGATRVFAWPGAEVATSSSEGVRCSYTPGLGVFQAAVSRNGDVLVHEDQRPAVEAMLADEHARSAGGVDTAVEIGVVDEIVEPARTRSAIAAALRDADNGVRGLHTNIPL